MVVDYYSSLTWFLDSELLTCSKYVYIRGNLPWIIESTEKDYDGILTC